MAANPVIPASGDEPECWPSAAITGWLDTCASLQLWTQMVGKVRLALTPMVNHWWNVPLYVSARGLTTSAMHDGGRTIELEFDFLSHNLFLRVCDGDTFSLPLRPISVAQFYREFLALLQAAGVQVKLWPMPVEIPNAVRFDQDHAHNAYNPDVAQTLWTILRSTERVLQTFRAQFVGKCSPVHFFWGSFDLAVTRFSGRRAPERPGADSITREAYSHEVSSVGFWPGTPGGLIQTPSFYAYAAPEPAGFRSAGIRPPGAYYHQEMGEFLLDYERVQSSLSPSTSLMDFCQSTYIASAEQGAWDRKTLER